MGWAGSDFGGELQVAYPSEIRRVAGTVCTIFLISCFSQFLIGWAEPLTVAAAMCTCAKIKKYDIRQKIIRFIKPSAYTAAGNAPFINHSQPENGWAGISLLCPQYRHYFTSVTTVFIYYNDQTECSTPYQNDYNNQWYPPPWDIFWKWKFHWWAQYWLC